MGSAGSGTFGDYKGGSKDRDKCGDKVTCGLEEIESCDYFQKHKKVPKANVAVSLDTDLHDGRLLVVEDASGLGLGLLPTKYNYLHFCMSGQEYSYEGEVFASKNKPLPDISVELRPTKG